MTTRVALLTLLLTSGIACSGIDAKTYTGWKEGRAGFQYYMPLPCLLVAPGKLDEVRIDFSKGKVLQLPGSGSSVALELGKLKGLARSETIQVALSDDTHVQLPNHIPEKSKIAAVQADATTGIVSVNIARKTPVGAIPKEIKLSASYGSHDLGSGRYTIEDKGENTEITSLGGATPAPSMSIVYLPDLRRVVGVEHDDGIGGSAELDLTLKDGWMLTKVGSKSDTQADETLASIAAVIGSIGSAAPSVLGALSTAPGISEPEGEGQLSPGLYCATYGEKGIETFRRVTIAK